MILYGADDSRMVGPVSHGRLEDNSLVIALALAFRLDAVAAGRPLLTALYATFSTSEAARLGPLPHLGICRRPSPAGW